MPGGCLFEDVHQQARDDRRQIEGRDLVAGSGDLNTQGLVAGVVLFKRATHLAGAHSILVGRDSWFDVGVRHKAASFIQYHYTTYANQAQHSN